MTPLTPPEVKLPAPSPETSSPPLPPVQTMDDVHQQIAQQYLKDTANGGQVSPALKLEMFAQKVLEDSQQFQMNLLVEHHNLDVKFQAYATIAQYKSWGEPMSLLADNVIHPHLWKVIKSTGYYGETEYSWSLGDVYNPQT